MKKVSVEQVAASEAGLEAPSRKPAPAPPPPPAPAPTVKAPQVAAAEPRPPRPAAKSFGELLQGLEDPTRITKIEKIAAGNGRLIVDIKDGDGRPLRQFDIALTPETKKVNIILDVKK